MSFPEPLSAIVRTAGLNDGGARFPFVWWANGAKFDYNDGAAHLFAKCGSAAEAFFLRPFTYRAPIHVLDDRIEHLGIEVIPQFPLDRYRLDFAVHEGRTRLAVEVDGAQWHHRSTEQVDADYVRMRRIMALGYIVVRFTAREAFKDAAGCWSEIESILDARRDT